VNQERRGGKASATDFAEDADGKEERPREETPTAKRERRPV
jgi:hypothetical protein